MTAKRFMIDDAGTLIDIETREMYDIVEEVCPVLNTLHEENQQCKDYNAKLYANRMKNDRRCLKIIRELENENEHIKQTLDDMIETERTELGKSVLKQFKEAIK